MPIWSKELLLPHNQLKLIYYLATIKANQFNLQILNYLDSTTFIQNVIPSISTTNSSIASLMIHSFYLNTNYYYTHKIYPVKLADKNPECIVCGVPNYICRFTSKATLGDLLNKFNMDEVVNEYKTRLLNEIELPENIIANYVIKASYSSVSISKSLAWSAYGDYIIENLKNNTNPKRNISIREVPYKTDNSYEYLGKYYEFEVGDTYLRL